MCIQGNCQVERLGRVPHQGSVMLLMGQGCALLLVLLASKMENRGRPAGPIAKKVLMVRVLGTSKLKG